MTNNEQLMQLVVTGSQYYPGENLDLCEIDGKEIETDADVERWHNEPVTEDLRDLVFRCMALDPEQRPTLRETRARSPSTTGPRTSLKTSPTARSSTRLTLLSSTTSKPLSSMPSTRWSRTAFGAAGGTLSGSNGGGGSRRARCRVIKYMRDILLDQ